MNASPIRRLAGAGPQGSVLHQRFGADQGRSPHPRTTTEAKFEMKPAMEKLLLSPITAAANRYAAIPWRGIVDRSDQGSGGGLANDGAADVEHGPAAFRTTRPSPNGIGTNWFSSGATLTRPCQPGDERASQPPRSARGPTAVSPDAGAVHAHRLNAPIAREPYV